MADLMTLLAQLEAAIETVLDPETPLATRVEAEADMTRLVNELRQELDNLHGRNPAPEVLEAYRRVNDRLEEALRQKFSEM